MKKRGKLTKAERFELAILEQKGYGIRSIARAMERDPSTISRELKRNKQQGTGEYVARKAHHKAYVRKKYSRFEWRKINKNKELRDFIVECLEKHWNPDEVSGYMKVKSLPFYVSKTAIYEWLYSAHGVPYCQHLYSQRYHRKKRIKKKERMMIPNRVSIDHRFKGANNRTRYGHLEVDTIVSGKGGCGAISVLVDRKSRYVVLKKLKTLKPSEHTRVLKKALSGLLARSVTFDNGIENRYHEQLNLPTFFCSPYSSWQKGSVENTNKMIRRYIPKGTNIKNVPKEYIKWIETMINKKPRKILGYRSASDVMLGRGLLTEGVAIEG